MFGKISIKEELQKEKGGTRLIQRELMQEVGGLLEASAEEDAAITNRLQKGKKKNDTVEVLPFSPDDPNVFSLEQVKAVCVNYRLRFLDTRQFKGQYPYEALLKVRAFEKKEQTTVRQFMIMAPSKMFSLLDPDKDPLLFANIGNGQFYLLHQWGNDLAWHRKFFSWPLRNLQNLLLTILGLTLLTSICIPSGLLHFLFDYTDLNGKPKAQPVYLVRFVLFFLGTLGAFALAIMAGLRSNKNLSDTDWNNKFLG